MDILARQEKIIKDFGSLPNWEDRYKKIIEIGKHLSAMPEELKIDANLVKGCQSQVWLSARLDSNGKVYFSADSDALIVKGLIGLLLEIYSGASPEEILRTNPDFLKALGFEGNLSPSRANGLHSMIKQIKFYATAFDYVLKTKK